MRKQGIVITATKFSANNAFATGHPKRMHMSFSFNAALLTLTLVLGLVPLLLTARFKRRLPELVERKRQPTGSPPVVAILPCKGLDPGFRENILALVEQDYPALELVFVVATEDDPAFYALQGIIQEVSTDNPQLNMKLLVAGISSDRAQKLNNQLAALDQLSDQTKVLVFVDSDIRPDRGFIGRLVAPLSEPGVGGTTGYRWYHPPRPTVGSLLRSTWNAGALPFLVDSKRNFAWGGAMAIRREIFERANIAEAWQNAVSDDMTFTLGVRGSGLELRFVPTCIAVSYEASTLAETLEFTNRQSVISRVYFPPLWWSTAIGHALANVLLIYGFFSLGAWFYIGSTDFLIGAGCLLLSPLQLVNAAWLFGSLPALLPQLTEEVRTLRWHYIFSAPMASILTLINTLYSLTTRRITWRGIQYELCSPTKTRVIPRED